MFDRLDFSAEELERLQADADAIEDQADFEGWDDDTWDKKDMT